MEEEVLHSSLVVAEDLNLVEEGYSNLLLVVGVFIAIILLVVEYSFQVVEECRNSLEVEVY